MTYLKVNFASLKRKASGSFFRIDKILFACLATTLIFALPPAAEAIELKSPSIEIWGDHIFSANVDESSPTGKLSVTSTSGRASIPLQLTDKLNLSFELSGSRIFFDWDNTEDIAFSNGLKPWDDFTSARLRLKLNYQWNPQWISFGNAYTSAAWEEEIDDSYSYGASIGTIFMGPYNLTWTLGVGSGQGPENGYWGVFGGIGWNQHKKEEGQPGIFASLNWPLKAEIGAVINEKWLVRGNLWSTGRIYRLANDNAVSPSGLVVRSVEATGIFLEYKPIKKFSITLGGSYVFRHQYEIQNENGNKIQSLVNIDAALGATLNFKFKF
jgi:hypothetical protein